MAIIVTVQSNEGGGKDTVVWFTIEMENPVQTADFPIPLPGEIPDPTVVITATAGSAHFFCSGILDPLQLKQIAATIMPVAEEVAALLADNPKGTIDYEALGERVRYQEEVRIPEVVEAYRQGSG
jgi:hypothetical protein